jgi:uncharacterized protein (DUF1697 family)
MNAKAMPSKQQSNLFIAILRGINVGGHNKLKMAELRAALEADGFANVQTYIQSGNVVFEPQTKSTNKISDAFTGLIQKHFQLDVPVVIRSSSAFAAVPDNNPWAGDSRFDEQFLSVAFLAKKPAKTKLAQLSDPSADCDHFKVVGSDIYLYCPNGASKTKLTNNFFEKELGIVCSTRNWRSIGKINELASRIIDAAE